MKNVFFKPWIGESYYSSGIEGKKLLILGESHICGGCNECGDLNNTEYQCREFTTNTIKTFLGYKSGDIEHAYWMNTFTKFGNILSNKNLNTEETNTFWNSVIFYNFVQFSTQKARKSPLYEEFVKSHPSFFEILDEYKPDLIIVWGQRLWDLMPSNGEYSEKEISVDSATRGRLYYYSIDSKKIPAYMINHPSSSKFDYSWTHFMNKAIEVI